MYFFHFIYYLNILFKNLCPFHVLSFMYISYYDAVIFWNNLSLLLLLMFNIKIIIKNYSHFDKM